MVISRDIRAVVYLEDLQLLQKQVLHVVPTLLGNTDYLQNRPFVCKQDRRGWVDWFTFCYDRYTGQFDADTTTPLSIAY